MSAAFLTPLGLPCGGALPPGGRAARPSTASFVAAAPLARAPPPPLPDRRRATLGHRAGSTALQSRARARGATARCRGAVPDAAAVVAAAAAAAVAVDEDGQPVGPRPWKPEAEVPGMTAYLDSLRWGKDGLVPVIAQNVDTGELLMQAYSDRAAVCETLQTGLATFYSRSRRARWCKGETSGSYVRVLSVHADCDRDSLVYLGDPIGPACHTGARTCWFMRAAVVVGDEGSAEAAPASQQQHEHEHEHEHEHQHQQQQGGVREEGEHARHGAGAPLTTLLALERTIAERRREAEEDAAAAEDAAASSDSPLPRKKPSWTARLLADEALLCRKVREEAGELCETLERREGKERAASEAADLLYHAMVLLNAQEVPFTDVMRVLRKRFGVSGVEEKAARPPK